MGAAATGLSETLDLLLLKLLDVMQRLARQEFLVASHIKPWRSCDNSERLSGANGLLLSPHVDKLFDRHWISFDSGGELIWQHEAAGEALRCWGIEGSNLIRPFSREQEQFLSAHRNALRH